MGKEEKIIKALLSMFSDMQGEITVTASGLVMLGELNITPREASWILKRLAKEIVKDKYFNQNLYVIDLQVILNEEGAGISES